LFGGGVARWGGADTSAVTITSDGVLVRHSAGPANSLSALTLCSLSDDGLVSGHAAICNGDDCAVGSVAGYKFETLPEARSTELTLLGEYGPWPVDDCTWGKTMNVRARDGFAFLARYADGLRILDVRNPDSIVEVAHVPTLGPHTESWNDVKLAEGPNETLYALLASDQRGVVVVEVTDPSDPAVVATMAPPSSPSVHTLFVDDGRAYLANETYGVDIWDITDPRVPIRLSLGQVPEIYYLHDLYVRGDRAYLCHFGHDLEILDVSNPAAPKRVGIFETTQSHSVWVTEVGGRTIALLGGEGNGHHLQVLDVTEGSPTFLAELARWETRDSVSIHNVMAVSELGFVAYYQDGLRVLDLTDPFAPVEIAHYQTWNGIDGKYGSSFFEGALGVDVHPEEERIYVADSHRGLIVLASP